MLKNDDGNEEIQLDSKLSAKLENFNIRHHPNTQESFIGHMNWWKQETVANRCKKCWLRRFDCYCSTLNEKSNSYRESLLPFSQKVRILMYYHYLEIGRSANTAHVFDELCPDISEQLLFGDSDKEIELFQQLRIEYENNESRTCILYPTTTSLSLSDWISQQPLNNKPIRLITLDGTYAQAHRQFKHLTKSAACYKFPLPCVKLDLPEGGCKSAIAGMMRQPGKDQICSFQAVIMALHQAGLNDAIYNDLRNDLDDWLAYILRNKIRLGKTDIRMPIGLIDEEARLTAADIVKPKELMTNKMKNKINNQENNEIFHRNRWISDTSKIRCLKTKKFSVFSIVTVEIK